MVELTMFLSPEFAAFVLMLSVSVSVGIYYGCVQGKQNTISEYLLGGKHMSVFPITLSLIASHLSGVTLLGVPTEVYYYGTQYLVIGVVNVVVIVVVLYVYLPVFYELQFTSVYEYLEQRFDSKIRALSSLLFALASILSIPIVVYIPALAYNQATGIDVHLITTIICVTCIFYTTIGGLRAVVWADAVQIVFTAFSLVFIIILGLRQVGGFGNMMTASLEGGRIEFFKMNPDPFLRSSFWTASVGLPLYWLCDLGIHPGAVQRFVALPTYNKARNALIYYLFGIGIFQMLSGLLGILIYTNYKDCDPRLASYIDSDRNLVPYFVKNIAANIPGITGLFISGIISAALSTMSAQLNTVAGTIYEDFVVKLLGVKVTDLTASIIMKCTVVVTGIICLVLVIAIEHLKGIVQMSYSFAGITTGGVLSVFTLGICFPQANSKGAMYGLLASLGVMTWIVTGAQLAIFNNEMLFVEKDLSTSGCPENITLRNQSDFSGLYRMNDDVYMGPNVWRIYAISYMHYSTLGTLVGLVVGLVVSMFSSADKEVDPKLLAPCIRKFVRTKAALRMSKMMADGADSLELKL